MGPSQEAHSLPRIATWGNFGLGGLSERHKHPGRHRLEQGEQSRVFQPRANIVTVARFTWATPTNGTAFEKLEGLSSHQSNVFHDLAIHCVFGLISAWKPELSANQNDENTARLLIDLNAKGLKSIQLLGHLHEEPDVAPARAFYFNYGYPDYEKNKTLLLSLCKKYEQPAIAAYESGQIRIFDASGRVEKGFTLLTMKPTHLRKVWSDMVKRKFVWLESGYRDASPVTICGPMYAGAGLRSDLIGGLTDEARSLCRYRPLQEKPDEASIIANIQWTAESLAADLFKAKQSAIREVA